MDNTFLEFACNIIADMEAGLTGMQIIKRCNVFALKWDVIIPYDDVEKLKSTHEDCPGNKRTALKRNLQCFSLEQQKEIILALLEDEKFSPNTRQEIIDKMNRRYPK